MRGLFVFGPAVLTLAWLSPWASPTGVGYGQDSPSVLTDKPTDLATEVRDLRDGGKFLEAWQLQDQKVAHDLNTFGNRSLVLSNAYEIRAQLSMLLGHFQEAREDRRNALEIVSAVKGAEHWFTRETRWNLEDVDVREKLGVRGCLVLEEIRLLESQLDGARQLQPGGYAAVMEILDLSRQAKERLLGENHLSYARSLASVAQHYCDNGDLERAESLLLRATQITAATLGKEHPEYAGYIRNLGTLASYRGRWDEAEMRYNEAKAASERWKNESPWIYAFDLNNLATVHTARNDLATAEALLVEAQNTLAPWAWPRRKERRIVLSNLAFVYMQQGKFDLAEPLLLEAVEISRRDPRTEANSQEIGELQFLASLYQATGRQKTAIDQWLAVLGAEQSQFDRIYSGMSEPGVQIYLKQARSSLDAIVALVASDPDDTSELAIASTFEWIIRRKTLVFDHLCQYRDVQQQLISDPEVADRASQLLKSQSLKQQLLLSPPAEITNEDLKRQQSILDDSIRQQQEGLTRTLALNGTRPAADRAELSDVRNKLSNNDALVEILRTHDVSLGKVSSGLRFSSPRYVAFVLTGDKSHSIKCVDLGDASQLDSMLDELRGRIALKATDLMFNSEKELETEYQALAVRVYQRVFKPLESAIGNCQKVLLAPDGELNRIAFESLVNEQGEYLVERYVFSYLTSGRDLLRKRIDPGSGTVVFANPNYDLTQEQRTSSMLQRVAQSDANCIQKASPFNTSGKLSLATTTQVTSLPERRSSDVRGLGWGALPGTETEARAVYEILNESQYGPVTLFLADQALEDVLRNVQSPRLLVIASHAFFLADQTMRLDSAADIMGPIDGRGGAVGLKRLRGTENPLLRSGIIMAGANQLAAEAPSKPMGQPTGQPTGQTPLGDGWVTAEEVMMMNLSGTELVVLSGCQTGLGDLRTGEGVCGLRKSFFYAGAQSLITSMYEVPDAETGQLMKQFYEGLKAGHSRVRALRNAELQMIEKRRVVSGAAHPFFWGSFIHVGDPN